MKILMARMLKDWNDTHREKMADPDSKLNLYCHIKQSFGYSPYLSVYREEKQRRALSRFRISAHNLPIETGRYVKPKKIPRSLRTCPLCTKSVGDESHYLLHCPSDPFPPLRQPLLASLTHKFPLLRSMSDRDKVSLILNNTDLSYSPKIGKLTQQILDTFKVLNTLT